MEIIKKIIKMILPPFILKILYYLKAILLKITRKNTIEKIKNINNKNVIIVGNGPSLRESVEKHLDCIKEHETICVNYFASSDYYKLFKPKYYVIADPVFFTEEGSVSEIMKQKNKQLIDALNKETTWKMFFLAPQIAEKSNLVKSIVNENIEILYYSDYYFDMSLFTDREKMYFYKNDLAIPPSQNVLNTAISLAIYCGMQNLYLIGADTSGHEQYSINQKNNDLEIVDEHFYGTEKRYMYKDPRQIEKFTGTEAISAMAIVLQNYQFLEKYAKKYNVNIYNSSEYSWIDAFERKGLENIDG